jgi:hypothetical protein
MLLCANKTVAMGKPVSLAPSHPAETPSSASCDSADFSVQVVSEAFVGKVRPLDYLGVCLMSDIPRKDHHASSPHDLYCAIGGAEKWFTCLILEYEDTGRNPQGGSAYASRHSLTARTLRTCFTTCSQVGVGDDPVGSADTDEPARGCSLSSFFLIFDAKEYV